MMELISRDEAVKTVNKYFIKLLDKIPTETDEDGDLVYSDMKTVNSLLTINKWLTKEIKTIPTVEERKEGKWIRLGKCEYKCPICGKKIFADDVNERNYCPSCGMTAK